MAITWNSITLKVLVEAEWNPSIPNGGVTESALLPLSTDLDATASVIQGKPTQRDRAAGKLYVATMAEYTTLKGHYKSQTTGTLADGDGLSGTYMISNLGPANYIQANCIKFDIEFVEAS